MEASQALMVAQDLYDKLIKRRPFVEKTDKYCEGDQPLAFASREWSEFHKDRYAGFSDNWCAPVVDASTERIELVGVTGEDRGLKDLWTRWQLQDGEELFAQGMHATATNSTSYVIVWGDRDDNPLVTWEHASEVLTDYDPATRLLRYAIKSYVDGEREFLTLFTPDVVWKWQRDTFSVGGQEQTKNGVLVARSGVGTHSSWNPAPGDDTWPLPNPIGVIPVVEFPNDSRLTGGAISDISGAMAMQDAINLLWAYLFGAADHASLPARVVMGQEPPKLPILNSEGQTIGEQPIELKDLQHGRLLWLTGQVGQDTKIGQWDAARLDVFTEVIEIAVGHIAAQTRTPPHYLNTKAGLSNLSGDALVAAETGLVKKVQRRIRGARKAVRRVFQLMALVTGKKGLSDLIVAGMFEFANPAMRSEAQLADALLKKAQIGYPFEYLMELDGIDPDDRERILAMRDRELIGDYERDGMNVHPDDTGTNAPIREPAST